VLPDIQLITDTLGLTPTQALHKGHQLAQGQTWILHFKVQNPTLAGARGSWKIGSERNFLSNRSRRAKRPEQRTGSNFT
jgi:hypothetical protein